MATLAGVLKDGDPPIARAAALALGTIGTAESAATLQAAQKAATGNSLTLIDALLSCAEAMLASNQLADASAIYKAFDQTSQPRLVRLAAARGLLACASKQA